MIGIRGRRPPRVSCQDEPDVVREARRILIVAKWRLLEQAAAESLAGTTGLQLTRLFPESRTIVVVAVDGRVVGQLRRRGHRWAAVLRGQAAAPAQFRTRRRAIHELRGAAERTY